MSRAREKALRDRYGKKNKQVPVNWEAVGALLKSGMSRKDVAGTFGITAETMAGRCKKEFGVTLAEKYFDVFTEGTDRKPISWERARMLFQTGAKTHEVAAVLEVTVPTLARRCVTEHGIEIKDWAEQCFAKTAIALRQKQVQVALGRQKKVGVDPETGEAIETDEIQPNTTMLIHLGKHYLEQTEKTESTVALVGVPDDRKKELVGLLQIETSK